jgi:threonine dehydrogenase-like Zn-dependent dehydrogenase
MLAATILHPHQLEIQRVPLPHPREGEVLIALEGTGVCASNLPLWEGAPWFSYPLTPGLGGHEGWGVVREVGSRVPSHWLGQRVVALSGNGYAQYDVARIEQVVPIPKNLMGKPVPGEALGCAMNIFARLDAHADQTVAIVGIGFLGALLTRLASHAGMQVIAITRRPYALDIAQKFGAQHLIVMDDHMRILQEVKDLTHGRMCQRVIEATGHQWPLDLASELIAEHGRLLIAGYHQDGPRRVNMQLWNWRGIDVINAHERNPEVSVRGMRAALSAVSEGWLDPSPLYSAPFALSELDRAFDATRDRPDGFMKALVTMEVTP